MATDSAYPPLDTACALAHLPFEIAIAFPPLLACASAPDPLTVADDFFLENRPMLSSCKVTRLVFHY